MLLQKLREYFSVSCYLPNTAGTSKKSMSLSELLELWQSYKLAEGDLTFGTMNNYRSVIRTLKNLPVCGMPVKKITTHELQQMFDNLAAGSYGPDGRFVPGYTHSHILAFSAVLQGAFRYAVYPCKIITENPMQQVVLHKRKEQENLFYEEKSTEHEKEVLTIRQFQSIVKYLEERNNPAVLPIQIAYYTGLRLGEVCALTWEDIHLQEQYMVVQRSVLLNRQEHNRLEFTTTKRNKVRDVYFGASLKAIFVKAQNEQERNRQKLGKEYKNNYYETVCEYNHIHYPLYTRTGSQSIPEAFQKIHLVCVRPDGAYESRRTVSSVCSRLKKQLPDMENFHFHMLRHTYTSNLLRAGARPKEVQELLGHSDIRTTMNVYAHADREDLKRIVERLE